VNVGTSVRLAISSYTPCSDHHACIAGSFVVELARMSNAVSGNNTVCPYTLGSFFFLSLLPALPAFFAASPSAPFAAATSRRARPAGAGHGGARRTLKGAAPSRAPEKATRADARGGAPGTAAATGAWRAEDPATPRADGPARADR
jgi:hypothetical protein